MATRKLDTKLSVSGEQQYKNAITEINRGIGVLKAEMQKVTAEFENNADSMEGLTAQTDVLNRRLESEKDKVSALRDALSYAVRTHGEASKEAMDYQAALYKAEAQVSKTESAIRRNTEALTQQDEALEDAAEEMTGAGDVAEKLAGKFGITLPDNLKKALDSTKTFSSGTVAAMGAAAAAVGTLVAAEKQLMDITKEAAEKAKETENQSLISGMSSEEIQQLEYASKIIGVATDKISDAQKTIITNMQSAKDGSEDYINMFARLGVQITNTSGQLRDSNEVFYEVLDALEEIENRTERDAAAMSLMGESARELNPIIAQGSSVLQQYAKDAQDTSYVLSTDQVAALAAVDEKYQELQLRQEAVRKQLASEFAPTAEKVYSEFGELVTEAGKSLDESGIARNLGSILESTISLIDPLGSLGNSTLPAVGFALSGIAGTLAWIADTANAAYALLTWDVDRWNTALGNNAANGQYSNMQKWMGYGSSGSGDGNYYNPETGMYEGNAFHASGTDYFRGGRTVVGENGPETVILPAGSRILNNQESRESAGGGVHIDKVVIDAKNVRDFNAAVNTFSNFRRIYRMGAKA